MDQATDLETLERKAYRASWSDGIVDIFLGLSLIWMGVAWIWIDSLAHLAGILPAILVAPMLSVRKRFVEARLGFVRWRSPRRRWERRNLWVLLAAGMGLFLLGLFIFTLASNDDAGARQLAPGIMAWLLALLAVGLALLLDAARMLVYAAVLAVSGMAVALVDADPGWPMLLTGFVATIVGTVLVGRFVRRYPVIDRA